MRYALISFLVILCISVVPGAQYACAQSANEAVPDVWIVDLNGAVGPASVDLIIRTMDDAQTQKIDAVVIRMDTPGGLDKAMRDLVQHILASSVPVVTYVAPNGARAASAGTYIAYASHVAAMAPASNIGSSTPVSIAPTSPTTAPELDAMGKKVINDAVAYLQSLAELRGRNIEWAEKTVREGANLRSSQAKAENVVDLVVTDLDHLLNELHGRIVTLPNGDVELNTRDANVTTINSDWRHDLLVTITDPSIAYALLIIGIYALILEFYNPGMIFPGVVGIIMILLGAYGLQLLPVNYVGLTLLLVGIALMVVEMATPTFGIFGIGGLAAFVFGSLIMFDGNVPGYRIPMALIAAFAVSTGTIIFMIVGMAMRARSSKVVSGVEAMIGAPATARSKFTLSDGSSSDGTASAGNYRGLVWAFGESWQAQASEEIFEGTLLNVQAIDGLILHVISAPESTDAATSVTHLN